jgi:hypothetical protein
MPFATSAPQMCSPGAPLALFPALLHLILPYTSSTDARATVVHLLFHFPKIFHLVDFFYNCFSINLFTCLGFGFHYQGVVVLRKMQ